MGKCAVTAASGSGMRIYRVHPGAGMGMKAPPSDGNIKK